MDDLGRGPGRARHEALRRSKPRRRQSGRCASRAWARPPASPAARHAGRAGRTRPCRPNESAPICATCANCWTSTTTTASLYGHFGQGCLHTRIDFDLKTAEGIAQFQRVHATRRRDLVVSYGGSLSGEHGDGQARAELLPNMFGPELVQAFREFKAIWDPDWQMNPGKMVDAVPASTRICAWAPTTIRRRPRHPLQVSRGPRQFRRTRRCAALASASAGAAAAGRCARAIMATREEKHSTRGRAHLLFEMFEGDVTHRRGATTPSRTRWTCAWPVKAVRMIVPSTWTWRHIRRNFSPITMAGVHGRSLATRWAGSTGGHAPPPTRRA